MASGLTDEKYNELYSRYSERSKGIICNQCSSSEDVIATVRGKPSSDLMKFIRMGGNVKLTGCTRSAKGYCKKCENFIPI